MIYWGTPRFIMKFFKNFTWHGDRSEKTIYLTFDDGPTPEITEKVLAILEQFGAKATFFCLGRNVDRHPDLYEMIVQHGHSVGNHTYSHLKGWKTPLKSYILDAQLARQFIKTDIFRPPYGRITAAQARFLGKEFRMIMWDVLTHDYNQHLPKKMCLRNAIRSSRNGTIIVFHDSLKASENMFFVLPRFLEYFTGKGFKFAKIE
jgi:peptidoglycan/xylan/chitin deacetylase (PgdA/CDA1 family)